jgi:hypothetical protein
MFEDSRLRLERIDFSGCKREFEELADAVFM